MMNIVYKVEFAKLKLKIDKSRYQEYKYEDKGYLNFYWKYEGDDVFNWSGFITADDLKEKLGVEQWRKFRNGKLEFIINRK